MLATPKRIDTLLPKGWPSRVRSAVVHAISMSNVVFTVTRSRGENTSTLGWGSRPRTAPQGAGQAALTWDDAHTAVPAGRSLPAPQPALGEHVP